MRGKVFKLSIFLGLLSNIMEFGFEVDDEVLVDVSSFVLKLGA